MAKRIDSNQPEIVKALRNVGATVTCTHIVGDGFPDLVVGYRGCNFLLEVKIPGGKLNEVEQDWHNAWRGQKLVVDCPNAALAAIGAI